MLKVSFGSLKQSADYNFRFEFLILPSLGWLKKPVTPVLFISTIRYRAALAWTKKKTKNNNKRSFRNEKSKQTEEQRKERLRMRRREKDRARRRTKKLQEEKKRSSETEDHEKQRLAILKRIEVMKKL